MNPDHVASLPSLCTWYETATASHNVPDAIYEGDIKKRTKDAFWEVADMREDLNACIEFSRTLLDMLQPPSMEGGQDAGEPVDTEELATALQIDRLTMNADMANERGSVEVRLEPYKR